MTRFSLALIFSFAVAGPAFGAGLGLPLPASGLPSVGGTVDRTQQTVDGLKDRLPKVRLDSAGRPPLPDAFERDGNGARLVKGEVLALSPSEASLDIARGLDFDVSREEDVSPFGMRVVVLNAPRGMSAVEALAALRAADPSGTYDFNHVFDPSGDATGSVAVAAFAAPEARGVRIGMVDAGLSLRHRALRGRDIVGERFAGRREDAASEHGTAVASLLVGEDDAFRGALPGARLYAADVFGGAATGGSIDAIVRALAWLADQRVAVVNFSLVGPRNAVLENVVRAMTARGHIIVAAIGNAGPAGPLAYPAGYDGVVGVTAVDSADRVQLDASRGPNLMFAAYGVDVRAADVTGDYRAFTGTSFAAPYVAAVLARRLATPSPADAQRAIAALAREAVDLGAPGRDPIFGYGLIAPAQQSAGSALNGNAR